MQAFTEVSSKPVQANDSGRGLLDLVHGMSLAGDLNALLSALLGSARKLVPSDGCAVIWVSGMYLKVLGSVGSTAALPGLVLPTSQMGAARPVVEGGRCIVVADTAVDRRWQQVPGEERARSWLGVPLVHSERVAGLIEWTAREPRQFAEGEVVIASEIAKYAAPLLHSGTLLEEMRRRIREPAEGGPTPAAAQQEVARAEHMQAMMSRLVDEALEATGARTAFAFLLDESIGLMRCIAASGESGRLGEMLLAGDGSLGGWALPAAKTTRRHGRRMSDREAVAELHNNLIQVLPLTVRGEVLGVFGVADQRQASVLPPEALRVMTHLASQASLVLEQTLRPVHGAEFRDYGTVVQSSPLGMGVLTITGDIVVCNPGVAELLSRSSRELVGRNVSAFLAASDRRRFSRTLEEVSLTGQRLQVDVRLRGASGKQSHMRVWLAPVRPSEEAVSSIVFVTEDVTALKILEEERVEHLRELREKNTRLRELDQLKSRFVANVSHELRTPLAVIKLFATLARKGRPEKKDHYLQTIEQETHRLETIVENILDLTRMDRQALQVHPEWVDVVQTVAQVEAIYAEAARGKGIELGNKVCEPLAPIWADKDHLVQMLTNLVDNALRYTPRGGQVSLEAEASQRDGRPVLEIRVVDTGVGIAADEQDKVFERFYRGANNAPGSTGTGLGLAIVRELIAQHEGTVSLRSRVGEGSTFILQFPVWDPSRPPVPAASELSGPESPPGTGGRS